MIQENDYSPKKLSYNWILNEVFLNVTEDLK